MGRRIRASADTTLAVLRLALGPAVRATNHPIVNWWPTLVGVVSPGLVAIGIVSSKTKQLSIPAKWWIYVGLLLAVFLFFRAAFVLYAAQNRGFPDVLIEPRMLSSNVRPFGSVIELHIRITNRDVRPISLSCHLIVAPMVEGHPRNSIELGPVDEAQAIVFPEEIRARGILGYAPPSMETIDLDPSKSFGGVLVYMPSWLGGWGGDPRLRFREHVSGADLVTDLGTYPPAG